MEAKTYFVKAEWDHEAGVWYVADSDIPGLVTEAATLEELVGNVNELAADLLEENSHLLDEPAHGGVPISIIAHQEMTVCTDGR